MTQYTYDSFPTIIPSFDNDAEKLQWAKDILNLQVLASKKLIITRYRQLALRVHPDRHPDDQENATLKFQVLEKAKEHFEALHKIKNLDVPSSKTTKVDSPFGDSMSFGEGINQTINNKHASINAFTLMNLDAAYDRLKTQPTENKKQLQLIDFILTQMGFTTYKEDLGLFTEEYWIAKNQNILSLPEILSATARNNHVNQILVDSIDKATLLPTLTDSLDKTIYHMYQHIMSHNTDKRADKDWDVSVLWSDYYNPHIPTIEKEQSQFIIQHQLSPSHIKAGKNSLEKLQRSLYGFFGLFGGNQAAYAELKIMTRNHDILAHFGGFNRSVIVLNTDTHSQQGYVLLPETSQHKKLQHSQVVINVDTGEKSILVKSSLGASNSHTNRIFDYLTEQKLLQSSMIKHKSWWQFWRHDDRYFVATSEAISQAENAIKLSKQPETDPEGYCACFTGILNAFGNRSDRSEVSTSASPTPTRKDRVTPTL